MSSERGFFVAYLCASRRGTEQLADFAAPRYLNVIPDSSVTAPRRLLVCSGKIGHNLRVEREKRKDTSVAIIFLEQLYPWPEQEMQAALDQHPSASRNRLGAGAGPTWAPAST